MPDSVRLYGHQLGYASFAQVTTGFRAALEHIGQLGGFVPVDCYDEEQHYPGASCPIAVNTGMPSATVQARAMEHEHRFLMLAPNSDKIPEEMVRFLPTVVTGLLSPSQWGCKVLQAIFPDLPVRFVPHGVHSAYRLNREAREARLKEAREGKPLRVLHMTSTNSERKGTKLLLRAWRQLMEEHQGELVIICRYEGYAEMCELVLEEEVEYVKVLPSDGMPHEHVMSCFNASHIVCQPSRAEGFGLVPLEAKAAGVPVVMTSCTGHRDHYQEGATVVVSTGPDAPTDDMDGAVAPALNDASILAALHLAFVDYELLQKAAIERADGVAELHSWENTTGHAMDVLIKEIST